MLDEIRICPNCRTENGPERARCVQCDLPLTAYSGQLTGEKYEGKLAAQVSRLEVRPHVVIGVAVFHLFFALFWPLAAVVGSFSAKPKLNEENTNYLAAAFGSIGPIFTAATLLPFAAALVAIAWGTWNQKAWGWQGSIATLGLFGAMALFRFGGSPVLSLIWLALSVGGIVLLLKSETKAWYGLD